VGQDVLAEAANGLQGRCARHARPLAAHDELLYPQGAVALDLGDAVGGTADNEASLQHALEADVNAIGIG
jgi:hypothetical protein